MPAEIKPEPSAQMANENSTETVSKDELEELRACKRKLEEIEPEFQANKRRLEEKDLELRKDKEKLKQLRALVANDVQFQPKRAKIRMKLSAKKVGHKASKYSLYSYQKTVAGFQWKLRALRAANADCLGLFLYAFAPANYVGPFEFEVDFSITLFNTFSSKDIHREEKNFKVKKGIAANGYGGFSEFAELEALLDPKFGFLQDGKIRVEVDFTVKTATLDHFLADPTPAENNGANGSG